MEEVEWQFFFMSLYFYHGNFGFGEAGYGRKSTHILRIKILLFAAMTEDVAKESMASKILRKTVIRIDKYVLVCKQTKELSLIILLLCAFLYLYSHLFPFELVVGFSIWIRIFCDHLKQFNENMNVESILIRNNANCLMNFEQNHHQSARMILIQWIHSDEHMWRVCRVCNGIHYAVE